MTKCIMTMMFVVFCLMSFGQEFDTSIIAILPFKSWYGDWMFKEAKQTTLTQNDLLEIENFLKQSVDEYNVESEKRFQKLDSTKPQYHFEKNRFIIDLNRYKRQYIAVINSKGEKEIYVNCFCYIHNSPLDEDYWKTDLVAVDDGGSCYFQVKINLNTKMYYEFSVNGVG